ncbi:testis-expressed protein 47 isoform X2 [Lagopus muta]|uniref:testis-expressed protein 47 isoform X2 n=1 Tax=Lagopus muta TaxID=64668 RepID=UPI0020A20BF2|nr:testis-expressed protein 47 isoform X2 [Lagopus muta]
MEEETGAAVRRGCPEPLELERRNLLSVRRRRLRRTLQCRVPLQRLLVVARLREEVTEEEVAGYHRELFEDASEYHTRERVSGLLLLSSGHVLHVVESCSSTIHFLIRALASLQNQGPSALLQEIKALVVAHNIPSRLFARWDVAVTSPVTHPEDSTQSQSIEEVVAECLTLLVNVADYVLKSAEGDSSDSLHTLAPELLIPAETIGYLCKAEECSSPVDFLRMYLSPIQPALDSDLPHLTDAAQSVEEELYLPTAPAAGCAICLHVYFGSVQERCNSQYPAQLHQIQAGNAPADGCAFMPALWASAAVLHCQPLPHVSPSSFISSSHPIISAPVLFPL